MRGAGTTFAQRLSGISAPHGRSYDKCQVRILRKRLHSIFAKKYNGNFAEYRFDRLTTRVYIVAPRFRHKRGEI